MDRIRADLTQHLVSVEMRQEVDHGLRGVRAFLVRTRCKLGHVTPDVSLDEARVKQDLGSVEPLNDVSVKSHVRSSNSQQDQ